MTKILKLAHILAMIAVSMLPSASFSQAQAPSDQIRALAWNSDGTRLAVAGEFGGQPGIQLRDQTGAVVQLVETPRIALSVSWSPDDTRLATRISEDVFLILDPNTESVVASFERIGATDDLYVHWNPNISSNLIATQEAGMVRLRSAQTGDLLNSIRPSVPITTLIWNQNGTQLLTISVDNFVRAWDTTTLLTLREIEVDGATSLALSPDGTQLAVSSWFDSVSILDAETFAVLQVLPETPGSDSQLMAVRWYPDGSRIAASGLVKITEWELSTGEVVNAHPLSGPVVDRAPQAMDYSPDGELTYVAGGNTVLIQPNANIAPNPTLADSDNSE